ncbi:hypothetical protein INT44_006186 [Umbelopsis vinacea]|uniref:Heterokaryon incompatibility domain-containing protein n=1 Tax=Umbelopsis vinacea TaxID=44442 RepID=A0A8H7PUA1_9FUNG|nr:hypothetical protein INT44_006186 [Umbelopsis vinacea]
MSSQAIRSNGGRLYGGNIADMGDCLVFEKFRYNPAQWVLNPRAIINELGVGKDIKNFTASAVLYNLRKVAHAGSQALVPTHHPCLKRAHVLLSVSQVNGYLLTVLHLAELSSSGPGGLALYNSALAAEARQISTNGKIARYTAFSHVWSQGALAGGLTTDKLRMLWGASIKSGRLHNVAMTWVDTFCVNQVDRDIQRGQLTCMAAIYASAATVVVVESGCIASRSARAIWSSAWATRAWTAQEAYHARVLHAVVSPEGVCADLPAASKKGQQLLEGTNSKQLSYLEALQVLAGRQLTVESDFSYVLGGLITRRGQDANPLKYPLTEQTTMSLVRGAGAAINPQIAALIVGGSSLLGPAGVAVAIAAVAAPFILLALADLAGSAYSSAHHNPLLQDWGSYLTVIVNSTITYDPRLLLLGGWQDAPRGLCWLPAPSCPPAWWGEVENISDEYHGQVTQEGLVTECDYSSGEVSMTLSDGKNRWKVYCQANNARVAAARDVAPEQEHASILSVSKCNWWARRPGKRGSVTIGGRDSSAIVLLMAGAELLRLEIRATAFRGKRRHSMCEHVVELGDNSEWCGDCNSTVSAPVMTPCRHL